MDRGYALAGWTESYGAGVVDAWLVKTDAHGNMEWQQTYGGYGGDVAFSVIETADREYVMAGYTGSSGAGDIDAWLVKIDAHGNMEWQQTYGGSDWDQANSVIETVDSGFAFTGYTKSYGASEEDFWLVKTDARGVVQWNRTYGGTDWDFGRSIIQTSDGGYALVGQTYSYGMGPGDAWLVKTDVGGMVQWNRTYGDQSTQEAFAVIQTLDGGFALAGADAGKGGGLADGDAWLVKTDAWGELEWMHNYGRSSHEAKSIIKTSDLGYMLAGWTWDGKGSFAFLLVKIDSNGNMEWQQTYGGSDDDGANSVIETVDSGFALAGYTKSYGAGEEDFWLVKIAPIPLTTPKTITIVTPTPIPVTTPPTLPLGDDSWRPRAPMPTPREDLAAVVVNERIYAIGGYNGTHNLATVEEYDPTTDSWRSRAPMLTSRGWLAATAVNGKIYAIGGWDGTKYLPTVEEYDPATDTWRFRADMPTHRYGLAVVAVGGRIYAIGWQNEIGSGYLPTVEEYDPTTDTWRRRADMATPRYGLATGTVQSRIYAFGGFNVLDGALATVEEYNPILNMWQQVADMPSAQISLTAGIVGGRLYAIGGLETYPSPVQEYDPLTNTWKSRTPLPTPRSGLAAAVVRGRLYAIGVYDGNKRLGTVEEYDPPSYDTDGDGFADDDELRYGREPLVPEPATETDTDSDGLLDTEEVTKYGTNPWVPDAETDTDGDGLANVAEVDRYETNPIVVDSDEDGLGDGSEVLTYKTDPLVEDTDGDTYSDGVEVDEGTNPLDPAEHPETTSSIVTGIVTGETSAVFIPGFTLVELVFALACLIIITRRVTKR